MGPWLRKNNTSASFGGTIGRSIGRCQYGRNRQFVLGGTGKNIQTLFRTIGDHADDCILFLDEFDAVAAKRGNDQQAAAREMNNIVIALLQHFDDFKGTIIAATNRGNEIDQALWRRFAMHIHIEEPDEECRFAILKRYLRPFDLPDEDMAKLTMVTAGAIPALLRQLMEGVKRDLILSSRFNMPNSPRAVFERVLAIVQPHEDAHLPPLWNGNLDLSILNSISWPPTRMEKAA